MKKWRASATVFIFLSTISTGLHAQSDTGTIRGTVLDNSGAAVPGARVTVTDQRTNITAFKVLTDDAGRYTAPALKASAYSISAEAQGFKRAVRSGVPLDVNQAADNYAVQGFGGITTGLMINPPFYRGQSIVNAITAPTNSISDGVPPVVSVPVNNGLVSPVPGILFNTVYQNPYGPNSYVQQWNLTVEREFAKDFLASLSYVGNKGTHNMYTSNINQADPGPGAIASRRPFPAWPDIPSMYMDGLSNYHNLQAKFQKRLSEGISFLAGYTFEKSIDNGAGESASPMIVRNMAVDRG
ncbi:MAG: carboxypeptidase-like regulatory domain-containing protein, partial [Bryobacteraceae bacterium]